MRMTDCFNKYAAFLCYWYLAGLWEQTTMYLVYPATD